MVWVGVALVGGLGALARFGLDAALAQRLAGFPWGTFAVNLSGAFVLGVVTGASVHGDASLVVGTGALGSYTTFSTWMFETHRLGEDGRMWAMAANAVASLIVGLAAAALGRTIGGAL